VTRGASNIHAIAAVQHRLRTEALAGQCKIHDDRPAVGFIEDWTGHPEGCCEECATFGTAHGYTVHRAAEVGE
jgi:hypothetical protein